MAQTAARVDTYACPWYERSANPGKILEEDMQININQRRLRNALRALADGNRTPWKEIFGTPIAPPQDVDGIRIRELDLENLQVDHLFLPKGTVVEELRADSAELNHAILKGVTIEHVQGSLRVRDSDLSACQFLRGDVEVTAQSCDLREVKFDDRSSSETGFTLKLKLDMDNCRVNGLSLVRVDVTGLSLKAQTDQPSQCPDKSIGFINCFLANTVLTGADLRYVYIHRCQCPGINFAGSDLRYARWHDVNVRDADFTDAKWNMPLDKHHYVKGLETVHGIPPVMQTYLILKALGKI